MHTNFSYLPYSETGYFSSLVNDYLANKPELQKFYNYRPDAEGLAKAIEARKSFQVNRTLLCNTLEKQYAGLETSDKVKDNIQLLHHENTFTICTAHQPNLLTGYLYFIYKILHAIKLANELNSQHPDKRFVPVYYMGSEDNDLEELGTFRFRNEKYVWDGNNQKGAVGRMNPAGLKPLLTKLMASFGPPGANCDQLQAMITKAYLQHDTIGKATRYLVNELFGRFGLIVLDPDEAQLKAAYKNVILDELFNRQSHPIIQQQIDQLGKSYKIQAHPREINLFYLDEQLRERIEYQGDKWQVLNTDISWNESELRECFEQHPERFSPNVMLRGMFQETILPDVAFIGGGAEVAYWMQLNSVFKHYNVFFPCLLLRQSVLWIDLPTQHMLTRSGIALRLLFHDYDELTREILSKTEAFDWQTSHENAAIQSIFKQLEEKALAIDPTLKQSAEAVLAKMQRQLKNLETKMLRAVKKKNSIELNRIKTMQTKLFPNGSLQERIENFAEYYLEYGPSFLDTVLEGIRPLDNEFLVVSVGE